MSEVSTARKLEYRELSDKAKKFKELKSALRAVKDVQNSDGSDNSEIVDLMMSVWEKINEHSSKLKSKYKELDRFKELDSTELWHVIIDSSPGWECEFDLEGEDSIRLFLIGLLPKVNEERKKMGLPEIKLSDDKIGISPEDLADLNLSKEKMEELF